MPRLLPNLRQSIRFFTSSHTAREAPRINQVGIQYLSLDLQKKVFPTTSPDDYLKAAHPDLLTLAQTHLKNAGLLGKKTQLSEPITIPNLPELVGKGTLDEHFTRIGYRYAQPYLSMAEDFLKESQPVVEKPDKWLFQSGWTRYCPGSPPQAVLHPLEDELVFDVEVLYKKSNYAVMCTAMSPKAWYGWVSPVLTDYAATGETRNWDHFIPFDTQASPKLLIGYNVSYDRARILEEYSVKQSKAYFLDAMSLHVSLSGFCSQQRPTWQKYRKEKMAVDKAEALQEESDADDTGEPLSNYSASDVAQKLMDDPWLNKGSLNSLANVAEFHCGIKMLKDIRDTFSSTNIEDVTSNFQELMEYCANDVVATFKVAQKVFPEFRKRNPHPVSFAALRLLGTLFLPTTRKWDNYLESAESVYQENREEVEKILKERVHELIRYIEEADLSLEPEHEEDPWLKQLNWTIKEGKFRKDGTPFARQAYLTGYPEWYRDLFKTTTEKDGEKLREMNITVRTRITPLLLRLKWEGYPLIWTDSAGWCFKVPYEDDMVEKMLEKNYTKAQLSEDDFEIMMPELRTDGMAYELFKVPHPEGAKKRCTLVMSKNYKQYFESGVLTSEYEYAKKILDLNATASYWMGNRGRIMDQFVVYADPKGVLNKFFDTKKDCKAHKDMGIIIPKLCVMGTVTRRATENTWLTASNSKTNRIGSELKALIEAPEGYSFVGADVDSEELWIASLIGDSMFEVHGGTALGWMTLEGDKNEKTDLHSKTAEIMGILRNDAKVFNYGRIYGAGVTFATRLLKQCNASLTDEEAAEKAHKLYEQTKGLVSHSKFFKRRIYHGGTESVMFNALEAIAYQENPKTPVLGASITDALTQRNLNKNNYLTSRINWTIQSSGVDYLHLLIISMEYLTEKFKVDARLMITVHDELRYFVKKDQELLCALLLQISNLWTRAMFCEQLGIKELPQSCAFFSEVDIDFVLRKEVGMECITPSHPESIGPGKSYDINSLLKAVDTSILETNGGTLQHLKNHKFVPRDPVITRLNAGIDPEMNIARLALENATSKDEWKAYLSNLYRIQRELEKPKIVKTQKSKPASKVAKSRSKVSAPSSKSSINSLPEFDILKEVPAPRVSPARAKKLQVQEEFNLSKDGDDILRREIENTLSLQRQPPKSAKMTFITSKFVNGKKPLNKRWTKESTHSEGSTPHQNSPQIRVIKTQSSGTTKNRAHLTRMSTSNYSSSTNTAPPQAKQSITKPSQTSKGIKKPFGMNGNYGFSIVKDPLYSRVPLVNSQPRRPQPAGLAVRPKQMHTLNSKDANDENFKRRPDPQVIDNECGLRRRRRND